MQRFENAGSFKKTYWKARNKRRKRKYYQGCGLFRPKHKKLTLVIGAIIIEAQLKNNGDKSRKNKLDLSQLTCYNSNKRKH